ncbi:hypothetical protein [Streptomyces sp. NPDC058092]|uniref:hypothetical protein n=1 Tax=Streptomyces sp. NPDC058092 TaxID=3346336 RepID=UPI0036E93163
MATQANVVPPSLVNELSELKRRMSAIERAPAPVNKFDRYPSVEWAAVGRGRLGQNEWSSCGIANVTGMVFDRVEVKYITDRIIKGRSEAEIRLAAFRHYGNAQREVVSASATMWVGGETNRVIGTGTIQWIHGIPFGWDYADDTTIYTIELQHRYASASQTPDKVNVRQMFGYSKMSNENLKNTDGIISNPDGKIWAPGLSAISGGVPYYGWVDVEDRNDVWDGSYNISNMHYCVGLPAERLPNASVKGNFWYRGTSNIKGVRDPDITEPVFYV